MRIIAVNLVLIGLFVLLLCHSNTAFGQNTEDTDQHSENAPLQGTQQPEEPQAQESEDGAAAQNSEGLDQEPEEPIEQTNGSDQDATIQGLAEAEQQEDDPSTVRISKVKIKGAKAVTKEQIEQSIGTNIPTFRFWQKKPVFDEEVLKDDMVRIQRLYANNGYYDAKATYELKYNKEGNRVEIIINITEGEPVKLTELTVDFEGDLSDKVKKEVFKAIPLKANTIFSPNAYQQTKGVISEILANNGYPKAEIDGEALVNRREKWARAEFTVDPGKLYYFGRISVTGNKTVKSYIVEREREFKEGEIYSLKKVNETQANIFQLGLFRRGKEA